MRNLFILLIIFCSLASCNSKSSNDHIVSAPINTDSLVSLWNNAWNNNDSAAILNLMSKDIVFISEGSISKGIDSLAKNFVGPNSKVLKNLKTSTIASGGVGDEAYYYGSYTHDVALKDTTIVGRSGVFSFIYKKEEDQWKIKVAEIE